jgi:hypothetical protein
LSGCYNQEYNDIQGSRWNQGFGFCNQYKGENFIQLVNINKEYNFVLNGKIFFVKDLNELFDKKINLNLTI